MTAGENKGAAGAKVPAAAGSGGFPDSGVWDERADAPSYSVTLWPNRSLTPKARRTLFWIVGAGLAVPLVPAFGTPVFWGLLPFEALAFGALWFSLRRNDADGQLTERLELWPDEIRVERCEPRGRVLRWRADPYWVRLTIHPQSRPEKYLTIKGGGREIELGAFLSPDERERLAEEIEGEIRKVLRAGA